MNNNIELKWNELKLSYQPSDFSFTTTEELTGSNGIIGQEGALNALELALKINAKGYNLYLCGESGVGKFSSVMNLLKKQALNMKTPQDILYVYNFLNPEVPRMILMQPGSGKKFKQDMDEFIQFIIHELPIKLQSTEANKKRQTLLNKLENEKEKLLMTLHEKAQEFGILVKTTKEGIGFAPLGADGDMITKEAYKALSKNQKETLDYKLSQLYTLADSIIEEMNVKEKIYIEELEDSDKEIFLAEIGFAFKYLKEKYKNYSKILGYLDEVCDDLLEHIYMFTADREESAKENKQVFPWSIMTEIQKLVKKYRVNLMTDHTAQQGAPIITDQNIEQYHLVGKILLDNELNMLHSDFGNIRPGLFHQANGGYLVLNAQNIAENLDKWRIVKKMLKTGYIYVENTEDTPLASVISLKPEPVAAEIKVILIGSYTLYHALYNYDEDFKRLFKMRIDFEEYIENTKEQVEKLAYMIKGLCQKENLPPVSLGGITKLIEYGNRVVQNPRKLPANIEILLDLVREGSIYAKDIIDEHSMEEAIKQREFFKLRMEKKIDEKIADNVYLIDTKGKKIGQVNGLALYTIDEYMFGRPVKISATTYRGQLGIIDIEKESGLGGDIHTKGVQIITGFLGNQFAQDIPLALSCNICFEQNYSEIDGDSASSAELYAILSSLAQIPVLQNIAATGSVNQYGQIQPIGGVNEKIEGFFKICKERGLEGNEGVIIPVQNKRELILKDEIIEAVKTDLFHIYAISSIEEGIEIITGFKYREIAERVQKKLIKYSQKNHIQ